jgi:hypothetical protein
MARNIFTVDAWIIDANGTYNKLSGYPKNFDSRSYDGDTEKALKRALGDFSEVYGAYCKRDDRLMQTVVVYQANGQLVDRKCIGNSMEPAPVVPEPEPEIEPEEPEEPEVVPDGE